MSKTLLFAAGAIIILSAAAFYLLRDRFQMAPRPLAAEAFDALYAAAPGPVDTPQAVFHLGHSLVGHDMPAMLAQIAGDGHSYASQLGWGTSLMNHWTGGDAIAGFNVMNAHDRYRDARDALASGDYDAVVLTEMVEIRAAIRYHKSARSLANWIEAAETGSPEARLYLYETWHQLDDEDGWLARIERDRTLYWEDGVLRPALAMIDTPPPVYVIPGGQVMAAFVRALEDGEGFPGLSDRTDLFVKAEDGTQDQIHFNDWGAYLMALTHYAVIYGSDPRGAPSDMRLSDGTRMRPLPDGAADLMQRIVWEVVTQTPRTGVTRTTGAS